MAKYNLAPIPKNSSFCSCYSFWGIGGSCYRFRFCFCLAMVVCC